jgi:uncharacterized protein YbjQ (UPF0145 family)
MPQDQSKDVVITTLNEVPGGRVTKLYGLVSGSFNTNSRGVNQYNSKFESIKEQFEKEARRLGGNAVIGFSSQSHGVSHEGSDGTHVFTFKGNVVKVIYTDNVPEM